MMMMDIMSIFDVISIFELEAAIPNPRVVDRYRSVAHLVRGRTEQIDNLVTYWFIFDLKLNNLLFC